jgi:Polyketide cyclase / dehydrase and lipid transport
LEADVTVDVTTEVTIGQPIELVAAYAAAPSPAPEWYANIESVDWETAPPVEVGSRAAFVARFLGRRLAYTYEIVELTPSHLVMRTAHGPFPMETTYTWTTTGDGATRMTLRNRGEPAGFSKLAAPFMAGAMRRANTKDLANLKRILEAT